MRHMFVLVQESIEVELADSTVMVAAMVTMSEGANNIYSNSIADIY